jgi:hypothetical protein
MKEYLFISQHEPFSNTATFLRRTNNPNNGSGSISRRYKDFIEIRMPFLKKKKIVRRNIMRSHYAICEEDEITPP